MTKTSQNKQNKTNISINARQAQKLNLDIDDMSLYVFEDKCSTISPSQIEEQLYFPGYGKGWTGWKICSCEWN